MRNEKGHFLKGFKLSPKTQFKKGGIPWNKGLHPEYVQRENHHRWRGGISKSVAGYVWKRAHGHPNVDSRGYVFEHRLVMEKKIGRYLKPEEIVHHMNGIRDDNRPENLELFDSHRTHKLHHLIRENPMTNLNAVRLGRRGGRTKTTAKQAAARKNLETARQTRWQKII